ncbi:hypothetical protein JYU34_008179 [Plutella xylostella]|uniref:Uncharacterized protein n=1 Tax=Plutella xylostella TaxID=51655 RepID=A0ABQ7QNY3_PLUXY|nr:hypothetical protein JYU34_008179 [Plutella xylostella]
MDTCSFRFTAPEGGARLATTAGATNTIATDHTAFIATRLLHEDAYKIRGSLLDGYKRSVYVTRRSRVACVAYDLNILTDLLVTAAVDFEDVYDWHAEMDSKQVLVTTSEVMRRVLEEEILAISDMNVLIIDSCHLICKDENLKFIMRLYRGSEEETKPRILALTYPLFSSPKKSATEASDKAENEPKSDQITPDCDKLTSTDPTEEKHEKDITENEKVDDSNEENTKTKEVKKPTEDAKVNVEIGSDVNASKDTNVVSETNALDSLGAYENVDDFDMYEKFEWKIDVLEEELCCKADLAEDIDGGKRFSSTVTKPKELIIEYSSRPDVTVLQETYLDLETFMRETVKDGQDFFNEHRYDPTEIYGDDLYEELKAIPDPTIEPKDMLSQFLYILDQLGSYGADKAAFSLLSRLEKLKIKIPYERHFLLLCVCTTIFLKIRSYADYVFSAYESEWDKIKMFSTPKVLRLVEILTKFNPPESVLATIKNLEEKNCKTDVKSDEKVAAKEDVDKHNKGMKTEGLNAHRLLKELDGCDFKTLSDKIEDKVNILEMNLKELDLTDSKPATDAVNDTQKLKDDSHKVNTDNDKNLEDDKDNAQSFAKGPLFGFPRRSGNRSRGRVRIPRSNTNRLLQMQANPDALCGIIFMKEPLMAKILFMLVADLSRHHPELGYVSCQYCAIEQHTEQKNKHEDVLKKFRMHECNLLLATATLEEGIDLPRCNLVLRWDVPVSYRSYGLCRGRARAPRSACAVLSEASGHCTEALAHRMATYRELDQIISRKCGCGAQDEPPQTEEDHADTFAAVVRPYIPDEPNSTDSSPTHRAGSVKASGKDGNDCEDEAISVGGSPRRRVVGCDGKTSDENYVSDEVNKIFGGKESSKKHVPLENARRHVHNSCNCERDTINEIIERDDLKQNNEVSDQCNKCQDNCENEICDCVAQLCVKVNSVKFEDGKMKTDNSTDGVASVDLNTAIALINRYCGKLPSDTFTRLTPAWWVEELQLPARGALRTARVCTLRMPLNCPINYNIVVSVIERGTCVRNVEEIVRSLDELEYLYCGWLPSDTFTRLTPAWWVEELQLPARGALRTARVCTLRMPLNCPINYNIVGHPMPTRALARRVVALQAARVLHRAGELDHQLMPVGKDNFKPGESDTTLLSGGVLTDAADGDMPRPGTTKRRQYYYKRTARAFTDCEPIIDSTDADIEAQPEYIPKPVVAPGTKRNILYAIASTLCCPLPERDNLLNFNSTQNSFPHISHSGTKRNILYAIASTLCCPLPERYNTRGRRLHAPQTAACALAVLCARSTPHLPFMRFVFAEVLRVRRRGMTLQSDASKQNNYYIVPTIKTTAEDGTSKINIDWAFLEQIYQHTEENKSEHDNTHLWQQDEEETDGCTCKKNHEDGTFVAETVGKVNEEIDKCGKKTESAAKVNEENDKCSEIDIKSVKKAEALDKTSEVSVRCSDKVSTVDTPKIEDLGKTNEVCSENISTCTKVPGEMTVDSENCNIKESNVNTDVPTTSNKAVNEQDCKKSSLMISKGTENSNNTVKNVKNSVVTDTKAIDSKSEVKSVSDVTSGNSNPNVTCEDSPTVTPKWIITEDMGYKTTLRVAADGWSVRTTTRNHSSGINRNKETAVVVFKKPDVKLKEVTTVASTDKIINSKKETESTNHAVEKSTGITVLDGKSVKKVSAKDTTITDSDNCNETSSDAVNITKDKIVISSEKSSQIQTDDNTTVKTDKKSNEDPIVISTNPIEEKNIEIHDKPSQDGATDQATERTTIDNENGETIPLPKPVVKEVIKDKVVKENKAIAVKKTFENVTIVKKMENPLLKPGEVFVFDPDKYREAVVTPWYRNQDQPQFFLVAEICWNLTPESAFPSATHSSFRHYYCSKYNVELTQSKQPLLDVDHTSARLNLLTPRLVKK